MSAEENSNNSTNSKRRRVREEEKEKDEEKRSDMADLAPFVAAVLRDKSMEDLVRENQRLRGENQMFRDRLNLKVTVVDQNGTLVAEADDLREAMSGNTPSDGDWCPDMDHSSVYFDCESVGPLEVKVGNRTVDTINPADFRVDDSYEDTYTLICDVGQRRDRPFPCVPSCVIGVHTSLKQEELPSAFWDIADQQIGLIETLRQMKNIDPGILVYFDRIAISIRPENVLMEDF